MGILRYQLKVHLHHLNRSLNFEVWLSQVPFEGGKQKASKCYLQRSR